MNLRFVTVYATATWIPFKIPLPWLIQQRSPIVFFCYLRCRAVQHDKSQTHSCFSSSFVHLYASELLNMSCINNLRWSTTHAVMMRSIHTPDTLGTLPDIAANARPMLAWLKCRTITTHARKSVADLSRNCEGFRARKSVHARVTESPALGTGVGRDIRQSPSRVRSVFFINLWFNHFTYKRIAKLVQSNAGAGRYSKLFRKVIIPNYSEKFLFQKVFYSKGSLFRKVFIPKGFSFRRVIIPKGLMLKGCYSENFLSRRVVIPKIRNNDSSE